MRAYTDTDDARREQQLSEIQIHLSERLNSTFTRDDVLCLVVNTFYSENKETIQLSNEKYLESEQKKEAESIKNKRQKLNSLRDVAGSIKTPYEIDVIELSNELKGK